MVGVRKNRVPYVYILQDMTNFRKKKQKKIKAVPFSHSLYRSKNILCGAKNPSNANYKEPSIPKKTRA
jgi:hypothetical protein